MAVTIRISPAEVREYARRTEERSEDARVFLNSVEKEVLNARATWEGIAAEAYTDRFGKMKNDLQKQLDESLKTLAGLLRQSAAVLEQSDRNISTQLRK